MKVFLGVGATCGRYCVLLSAQKGVFSAHWLSGKVKKLGVV